MEKSNYVRSLSPGSRPDVIGRTALSVVVLFATLLVGCRSSAQGGNLDSAANVKARMQVTSPAFENGGWIPAVYSCIGQNSSPELHWTAAPAGTQSLALILADPDTQHGTFIHWVIFNIPPTTTGFPASVPIAAILVDGTIQGRNGAGKTGFIGPCPPLGGAHRYFFRLFALDQMLALDWNTDEQKLMDAMKGHILATGELMGRFQKNSQ